ncbi:MAG: sulfate transporter CysZ [Methylococcaceae bacterium]|nr:sulfate transporter CysZ [Methylococcaceae bacterium]
MNDPLPFISGPLGSMACLLRGLKMLGQPGLRHFLWAPLLVNLVLYSLGFWAAGHYFSAAMEHWSLPAWLDWLHWLLWPLFALMLFIITFFTFTLMANLVASPFYGPLAEKVRKTLGLTSSRPERDPSPFGELAAGFGSELRRMGYFAWRALPLIILSLIPGLNIVAAFLWVLFGAWSLSLEYLAYPLEAQGMLFPQQRELAKSRRLETLAFGGAVMLGLSIPLVNILIPPAAVIGATLYLAGRQVEWPVKDKASVS